MSARAKPSRRPAVQPAEPLRLFAIVGPDGNMATRPPTVHPLAWSSREDAETEVGGGGRVVEFIEVRQPPVRETPWGEGQHDHVTLGPGVRAALRITKDGRVMLTIPGGELDVTDGGTTLGAGLLEAGRRAAQIRVQLLERARRRRAKPLCKRCGQSLFGYDPARLPLCPRREAAELCEAAESQIQGKNRAVDRAASRARVAERTAARRSA